MILSLVQAVRPGVPFRRLTIVGRLVVMTMAWAFLVVGTPAGAAEPSPAPLPRPASTGARERSGLSGRTRAHLAAIERARARRLAAAAKARAARLARIRAARIRVARARAARVRAAAIFLRDHRCPVDQPRRWMPGDYHPAPFVRSVDITISPGAAIPEPRGHYGIDLFSPRGTPVRAPFDGHVRFGTSPRGGMFFKLVGNGGYAYGAHMSGFGKGGWVRTTDIIGYVGNTGNARVTGTHLHFEWHPGGGKAANPAGILFARC